MDVLNTRELTRPVPAELEPSCEELTLSCLPPTTDGCRRERDRALTRGLGDPVAPARGRLPEGFLSVTKLTPRFMTP